MPYTDSDYALAVWTYGSRTLATGSPPAPTAGTDFYAAAVWAYSTRTLTSGGTTVSGAGTATGTATASGVGASTARSAGSATGAATAAGVGSGATSGQGAGSASGVATATAAGASTASSAGSAAGVATASAVGSSSAGNSGGAAGSSTASGVGASVAASAGTAAGSSTASGVGSSPYPDLVAALVAQLRSEGVGASLGETTSAKKIWSDGAMGSPQLPWAEVEEPHEDLTPETPGDDGTVYYVGAGEITLDVYAAGKLQARQLRTAAVSALNDAPLTFSDGVLLQFRLTGPLSPPVQGVSVAAPKAYLASAKFGYVVERTF